jgi:hypothetical protein
MLAKKPNNTMKATWKMAKKATVENLVLGIFTRLEYLV